LGNILFEQRLNTYSELVKHKNGECYNSRLEESLKNTFVLDECII